MGDQVTSYDDAPSTISQATEVLAQGEETVPFAADFVPLPAMIPGYTGYETTVTEPTPSTSQKPQPYDLDWVAGDTVQFQFFFDNVCWTDIEPGVHTGVPWQRTTWQAQVRARHNAYWGYWWPPVWPGRWPMILNFVVTSEFVTDYLTQGPGTVVTMTGQTMWPGKFLWDLQTKTYPDPMLAAYNTRTWLSGKATIAQQTTQDQPYPPSNWPVYQYP